MGASKGQREDAVAILLLVEDHEAHDVGSRGLDVKTRVRWAWEAARKSGVKLRFLSVNVSENTLNGKHGLQLQSEVGPILVELLRRSRMAAGRLLPRLAKTLGIFLHVDAGSAGRAAEAMLVAAVFATDLSVKAGVPVLVLGRPPGRAPRAVAALVAHISDLAPVSAEAAAAQVEAASDTSKDDEAEQAVETSPSSPSDADDASANVRAEDVPEDKDSLAASKGDGGFREEVSGSDALQLDGAGEVASALAAMMSAVGGLQKSIGSLEEVELPIDSAPLAVEEKDDRPAPGGVAEILAGLNAAMGSLREEAPEAPAPAAEQELSLEELEDRVLLQKVLVKQLRSDYEARFERSQSLQQALDDLGTEPQELQVDVVRARNAAAQLRQNGDEAGMWTEDRVAQGLRLYEARRQSHEVARCLAKETGEDLQALRRSKGHVSEEVAKEVLAEQQQRIETLKQDARAQDEKLLSLRADLSSVLDFIVRVHIDQQGGPSRRIVRHELLPAEFSRAVRFSDLGEAQLQELVTRYEEALMGDPSKAPSDSTGSIAASTPSAVAAPLQRRPPPPLPSHEPASSSFAQERLLLRSRLNEEMQKVAAILANDSTMPSAGYPTQDCQREELLRAAAWGETRSIKESSVVLEGRILRVLGSVI
eukprot:s29_g44.t2